MSTPFAETAVAPPAPVARQSKMPAWLREPLLHFMLLGGLLFTADHYLVSGKEDPQTIVVGAEVDLEARRLFAASRGRQPTAEELATLRERWLYNEVLYREGLSLRVDQGDSAIRERVIFKTLSVVDASLKLPPYDDKLLRQWFESRRGKYDEPERFDFQEAVVSPDTTEAALHSFVQALNRDTPGDARAGLRVFTGRPQANLLQSYGADFVQALARAPRGEWRVQPTRDGPRAIRLDAIIPTRPADFEALKGVVLQDWTDATLADQRTAAVRSLAGKYTIRSESGTP